MSLRAVLTTLALLLVLVPPVQAGNVALSVDEASVSDDEATVELSYHLDLDLSGDIELLSVVESNGAYLDHQAAWTGEGFAGKATSRTTTATVDDVATDHTVDFTVRFTLAAGSPPGIYDLRAYVRQRGASGGNAALTDIDVAATRFQLLPPSSGGGGGGGDFGSAIGPVTGLAASDVKANGVRLTWDLLAGAGIDYQVHRSTVAGFEPDESNLVRTVSTPQFTDGGLLPETTYRYRVRGIDDAGRTGPFSPELSVRTAEGPDTTSPEAVAGLQVVRATERSVALAWSEGRDDRGVVSYTVYRGAPGFTPSASNRLTSTSALSYTDTAVVAATSYAYAVRAVDGAGNIGPPSAIVEAHTDADPNAPAPAVNRIVLIDSGQGWRLQWGSDEPGAGSVLLTGPGVQRSVQAGSGASFSATLGDLPIGKYAFDITVASPSGKTGQVSGRFLVEAGLNGRLEAAGAQVTDALATRLGVQLDGAAVYFVDADQDGTIDRVMDADGRLSMERPFPQQRQFLVAARGTLLLLGTDGSIDAVEQLSADVMGRESGEAVHRVSVRIPDKQGWLVASLADPSPQRPLLGIERADGTPLPDGSAWREGNQVRFIDDPAQDYVLLFDNAPGARGAASKDGGLPDWVPYAAGAAGIVVGMLVMALLMRRRKA